MKTLNQSVISLSALLAAAFLLNNAQADSFTFGDLVVVRIGDGTTALANSTGPISVLEINTLGSLVQPAITVPSGNGGLQVSGTATSEGQMVLNADGQSFTIAGYVPPYGGSGSLSGRSAVNAPRGFVTIGFTGAVSPTTTIHGAPYSGQNIRSGFVSGSDAWFAGSGTGSGSGIVYDNGSTSSTIQGVNSRVFDYYGGNLFFSTGTGTTGIYKYTGTPTLATSASAFLTGVTGQGASPYDFVFSPDGNTLYVADDAIGVQKFTFNGTVWSLAYNFTDSASANKAYGLAVDFNGSNPVLYWTTPSDIWMAADTGSGVAGTSIASAGANYAFRGLEIIPEPSTFALTGMGLVLLLKFRRTQRKN